jgi:hypothetical protein
VDRWIDDVLGTYYTSPKAFMVLPDSGSILERLPLQFHDFLTLILGGGVGGASMSLELTLSSCPSFGDGGGACKWVKERPRDPASGPDCKIRGPLVNLQIWLCLKPKH